ncbi:FecR family protein [Gelidibacter sediminis]|uniref:FecR family protein n=1 Tax=Gelidibacter sediminis TaxID=1608710 RepID=A0A4R7PZ68_9FLAO|nr:FecR family protein [Gelidibacter sediminis]TDU40323.1 FecR family protein [Gelidibacter sediminis]
MDKERDILKWFEGELSFQQLTNKYPNDDFSTLEKVNFYSKQIKVPKVDTYASLDAFKLRNSQKQTSKVFPLNYKSFLKIAAVFIVLITSSYFLFFNTMTSYTTTIAQTDTLTLPDNSEVVLNANSKIFFNKKAWKDNRNLNLEGEAFFKVTKGSTFTVQTKEGEVKVLGTQFNVNQRPNYFEIHCYEGSVRVNTHTKYQILAPGQSIKIIAGTMGEVENFNAQNPSWLNNESSFSNVPLWQVIKELEVQYDIRINASKVNTSQLFTGTFTHSDKNIALQSVTIPLRISFKIDGKAVEFYNNESN